MGALLTSGALFHITIPGLAKHDQSINLLSFHFKYCFLEIQSASFPLYPSGNENFLFFISILHYSINRKEENKNKKSFLAVYRSVPKIEYVPVTFKVT